MKILENNKIAQDTYEMVLEAQNIESVEPGQFMHLKTGREDLILRRPISIASFRNNTLKLVYKVLGEGTEVMSQLPVGYEVDALGPLGNGFKVRNFKEVLVVGGGMGVAPLYQLCRELVENGAKLSIVLGFGTKDMVYYLEKFMKFGQVIITTDDGSMGIEGNVSKVIPSLGAFDAIYACGPLPLLNYLKKTYEEHSDLYLSLEERMACGIGACYACDTKDKKHRVCTDGPVFNAQEVEI
ncbi:MAG: dihydroorotate dehydrogenase electron transfer subunit [Erysipelothrix sp.]|nr:dihydroorotate dehydrogenase electron transfer subunit [Erysipelothrix sp.]